MKNNKLIIRINKSVQEVFDFLLDPKNTPLWIDSLVYEETNEYPTRLGTRYRNRNKDAIWNEYTVTKFEANKLFEFTAQDNNYHVRYTFKSIHDNLTDLEYYEWVEQEDISEPFTIDILQKLKRVLEE